MRILPFVISLSVLVPIPALAQNASPTAPTQLNIIATGGFLGQLDGFCEQPGGTYDLEVLGKTGVQSCADPQGKLQQGVWPIAMGGLLGASKAIAAERYDDAQANRKSILVLSGNNQVANFTFLNQQVLTPIGSATAPTERLSPSADRVVQQQVRFRRFWQEIAKLNADAIGLAVEDFVRSLRDPREDTGTQVRDRGSMLHRWLRQVTQIAGIPIIGSNVVIKTRHTSEVGRNVVKQDAFSLTGVTSVESIGWLAEIKVAHPRRAGIDLTLWEIGPVGAVGTEKPLGTETTDGKAESTTLDFGALRPGYRYQVRVREGSNQFVLSFQTHLPLTPRKNSRLDEKGTEVGFPGLDGFPVVAQTLAEGSPLLILSVVDPATKKLLGGDAWKWKQKPCGSEDLCDWDRRTCPEGECEIDFMSPSDGIEAAIVRSFATDGRKPFIILLSALPDQQTQELLDDFPEIRMVVLHPESLMLGRASRIHPSEDELEERLGRRNTGKQAYSGDLGLFGIFTGDQPAATTLVARPEWIGETTARLSAEVQYSNRFEWLVDKEAVEVKVVPGAALAWTAAPPCPLRPAVPNSPPPPLVDCTEFFMRWPNERGVVETVSYGTFPSYQVCEDKSLASDPVLADKCTMFSGLAADGDFLALAGDAFRRATGSEMAIVPGGLVDPDARAWLESLIDKNHTRVMTRLILERAIYRSFRIVRATVAGDQLVATIEKALKAVSHEGSCIVGIDATCKSSVDPKKPDTIKTNGRLIDSRSFYTIAMPEGLAEELSLPRSGNTHHTADGVSALHQRLIRGADDGWYLPGRDNTLAARIQKKATNQYQFHTVMSSLEFGYSDLHLNPDPRDVSLEGLARTKQLKGLDVEFAGIKPSTKWTGKADFDLAVADTRWVALRGIFNGDLSRRLDYKVTGNELIYDKNTYSTGARLDGKLPMFNREVRPYLGYFIDGEIQGPPDYKTATFTETREEGFSKTTPAKAPTAFDREPRRYRYRAYGVDVLNVWKLSPSSKHPLDITRASLQYATGRINRVIGATIGNLTHDGEVFKAGGVQGALDAYYADHLNDFEPGIVFQAIEDTRHQTRWQAELNFEPRLVFGSKTWKFGTELRYRRFTNLMEATDLRYYMKARFSLSLPIVPRFELVPAFEFHDADNGQDDSFKFRHTKFEATIKVPFVVRGGLKWPGWLFR